MFVDIILVLLKLPVRFIGFSLISFYYPKSEGVVFILDPPKSDDVVGAGAVNTLSLGFKVSGFQISFVVDYVILEPKSVSPLAFISGLMGLADKKGLSLAFLGSNGLLAIMGFRSFLGSSLDSFWTSGPCEKSEVLVKSDLGYSFFYSQESF